MSHNIYHRGGWVFMPLQFWHWFHLNWVLNWGLWPLDWGFIYLQIRKKNGVHNIYVHFTLPQLGSLSFTYFSLAFSNPPQNIIIIIIMVWHYIFCIILSMKKPKYNQDIWHWWSNSIEVFNQLEGPMRKTLTPKYLGSRLNQICTITISM